MTHASPEFTPLSWRDPDGFVLRFEGRILRAVRGECSARTLALLGEPWMANLMTAGFVPGTRKIDKLPAVIERSQECLWLEHDELPLPCYPHEITALQLYDSAQLTLKIAILACENGWALKDASAWNVLHSRGRPVFVDFLSFEKLAATGAWIAYGQFARHFVLPLLLHRETGVTPDEIFQIHRDGIVPDRAYDMLGASKLWSTTGLEFVMLPRMLAPAGGRLIAERGKRVSKPLTEGLGQELLLHTLRRLQRKLKKLRPDQSARKSPWKEYEQDRTHYSDADLSAKTDFVRKSLPRGSTVLDLGCNAGEFSLLAAGLGNSVIAADFDHQALHRLYERVGSAGVAITPLVLNLGRPTPAVGWRNDEVPSFLVRFAKRFECILALGLLHHLLVSERASLTMIAELLDGLGARTMIVEWVDPQDPKFQQVAGLNAELYADLNSERFEECFSRRFTLESKAALPCGTRMMYQWSRRQFDVISEAD